ncbi:hypothetical protein [Acaryochloris marina]|uniref:hypothetical protein n=1 Tax=Acaryochloris marina TaxID=155978 RepID=UPI0021C4A6FB|nr:hypothetical protein [Acaryochloris marina]BDM83340.1 hypothetical protein AM10699_62010 [Acaryochloris marina MBIC10699]
MSYSNSWKYLTVREFLEGYNWSGESILQADPIPEASESIAWQRQTVQTFFSQFNWTGRLIEKPMMAATAPSFSTHLNVQAFFQHFIWEGQPNIVAMPIIPASSSPTSEDDLNLNDFSDMF